MEFDKTKVFTVLNAEDAPLNGLYYFAETLGCLKEKIKRNDEPERLDCVRSENCMQRFYAEHNNWSLAYLVSIKEECGFKPLQPVLVRDSETKTWELTLFARYDGSYYPFLCIDGECYRHCIPYEGNEYMLGTDHCL